MLVKAEISSVEGVWCT